MRSFILIACLLHVSFAAPQFITFKDGKVGVNFAGFRADAGLGGLLTGDAAHGGLSASAGTPWGPQAAAGLGGNLNDRASGLLYAGAEANPSVGASTILGGGTGAGGIAGAEAHSGNKIFTRTVTSVPAAQPASSAVDVTIQNDINDNGIQKITPHKKYNRHRLIKQEQPAISTDANVVHTKQIIKTVSAEQAPTVLGGTVSTEVAGPGKVVSHPNVVHSALNIPIGILRSLQESLTGLGASKYVAVNQR